MALAKLYLPQSARLEFRNQASDLLTAAPFPNLNLFDVGHAHSSPKSSHYDQMGWSDGYLELVLTRSPGQRRSSNCLGLLIISPTKKRCLRQLIVRGQFRILDFAD